MHNGVKTDRAQLGIGYNRRLLSVQPEQSLDISAFMAAAADDIGSENPSLDSLPESPCSAQDDKDYSAADV